MKATQITIGRFHHFHLARQLEKHGYLEAIFTGYPKFKLKDEQGIPSEKIRTFPWLQGPFMMRGRLGLEKWNWLNKEWAWLAQNTLDAHVARHIRQESIVIALSGSGLRAGKRAQDKGGMYVCDRGSSHILYQDRLLSEEYKKWGFSFTGIDKRIIKKEESEYELADMITVPSEFVKRSFLEMGVPSEKLRKIPYGARLERFSKTGEPDKNIFRILWVGGVSIRKGFMYLLHAFQQIKHPGKELMVIGSLTPEVKQLLQRENLERVVFKGIVPNNQLPDIYSTSHVFVLPSIEEGLAMVQGEALACGCPIISSVNSGAEDIITDRVEGFVIPIRSSEAILTRLQQFIDDPSLRQLMSEAAQRKTRMLGGWDTYGLNYIGMLDSLRKK